jgi:hypothetical protein
MIGYYGIYGFFGTIYRIGAVIFVDQGAGPPMFPGIPFRQVIVCTRTLKLARLIGSFPIRHQFPVYSYFLLKDEATVWNILVFRGSLP